METSPADIQAKSKKRFRILMALCVVGAFALKLSFIFFFIGMMPSIVAYVIDHDKHKYIFSTVTAFNLAGVFPFMMEIYLQGNTFVAIKSKLLDAVVWLTMYSAASMGWAIVWVSPILAAMALEAIYAGRILHLESVQKKLVEEWGESIITRNNAEQKNS